MSRDPKSFILEARVENMMSPAGNDTPNQFRIVTNDATIFQSYRTVIAIRPHEHEDGEPKVYLSPEYDCSQTTIKYLKQFLGHPLAETRKKIKEGTYQVVEGLR